MDLGSGLLLLHKYSGYSKHVSFLIAIWFFAAPLPPAPLSTCFRVWLRPTQFMRLQRETTKPYQKYVPRTYGGFGTL